MIYPGHSIEENWFSLSQLLPGAPPLLARGGTLWPLSPSLCWDLVSLNLCASCTGCSCLWLHMCISPIGSKKWCFLEALSFLPRYSQRPLSFQGEGRDKDIPSRAECSKISPLWVLPQCGVGLCVTLSSAARSFYTEGYLQMNPHPNYSEEITETDAFRDISGGGLCMQCFIVYPWVLDRIFGSCVPEQGFLTGRHMASKRREFKGERSSESLSRLELEKGQRPNGIALWTGMLISQLWGFGVICGAHTFSEHALYLSAWERAL